MDKKTVQQFIKEDRPVWFLGTWSVMPIKARITKLCSDERAGDYAEVDYIHDDECDACGSSGVLFDDLYPSKEDLIAAMYKASQEKIAEIKASIRTKEDCIAFMFHHTVSCAEEYTDWTARKAIQEIAKERWNLDLE